MLDLFLLIGCQLIRNDVVFLETLDSLIKPPYLVGTTPKFDLELYSSFMKVDWL